MNNHILSIINWIFMIDDCSSNLLEIISMYNRFEVLFILLNNFSNLIYFKLLINNTEPLR